MNALLRLMLCPAILLLVLVFNLAAGEAISAAPRAWLADTTRELLAGFRWVKSASASCAFSP